MLRSEPAARHCDATLLLLYQFSAFLFPSRSDSCRSSVVRCARPFHRVVASLFTVNFSSNVSNWTSAVTLCCSRVVELLCPSFCPPLNRICILDPLIDFFPCRIDSVYN